MPSDSGRSTSVWMEVAVPEFPRLDGEAAADVCVVGAGIAGMTTAYLAAREGKSVIVLDDGPIGGGETGRTTAHLASALDDRYFELERLHGEKGARLAAESHSAAIHLIESIIAEENIDCDFARVDGYLFEPPGADPEVLDRELEATHRAGLTDIHFVAKAPLHGFDTGRCLVFPNQAQFHPLKYLSGLARAIAKRDGVICTHSWHVKKIEGGDPAKVVVRDQTEISANAVVVA